MKKITLLILFIIFISCNPFHENKVLDYKVKLYNLALKFEKYQNGTYDRDEIDEFLIGDIRSMDIDLIVKNGGEKNPNYSGFAEEHDSLIIFIKKANNMMDLERRIFYDLNKKPRNFGNTTSKGASYKMVQLDERWYYSEIGFD